MTNISADKKRKAEEFLLPFQLHNEKLYSVSSRLWNDMVLGLEKVQNPFVSTPVKMLPTFIHEIPNGTEKGDFLSLDVGGTNLRILYVHVENGKLNVRKDDEISKQIPDDRKKGSGEEFFNYIADCLGEFLDSRQLKEMPPLGFTFSFPCRQEALEKGSLIQWTKDFSCSGVVGQDVVQLLKDAMMRWREGKYKITSVALVNDTVGTMMGCGSHCEIGIIIGTGTNACYMEEMRNVKRVDGDEGRMCINTEWGGFGDDASLKDIQTEFDKAVDCYLSNPGMNTFEKMISGRYLGEVVRLVLVKMAMSKLLFEGATSETLLKPYSFKTEFMSHIESEDTGLGQAQQIFTKDLGLPAGPEDCEIVRLVCDAISTRAAQLCGAALATIANRIRINHRLDHLTITVGLDGSVYTKYPQDKLQQKANTLAPECNINYKETDDSSGKGVAMVMAVTKRMKEQR